jgi:hypothetical protein
MTLDAAAAGENFIFNIQGVLFSQINFVCLQITHLEIHFFLLAVTLKSTQFSSNDLNSLPRYQQRTWSSKRNLIMRHEMRERERC